MRIRAQSRIKNAARRKRDAGFTLVELLVTMAMVTIVSGIVYSSFSNAVNVHSKDSSKMNLARDMRVGLQGLSDDMSNAVADDTNLDFMFLFQDMAGPEGYGQDIVSFVTSTEPNTAETQSLNNGAPPSLAGRLQNTSSFVDDDEDEAVQAASDLIRIAYLVGTSPDSPPAETAEIQPQALLRVTSPTLDIEELLGETGLTQDIESMLSALMEEGAEVETVVDSVLGLEFEFFDGEQWTPMWNVEEQGVPLAARAKLTVGSATNPANALIRSTTARIAVTSVPGGGGGAGN